MRQNSFGWCGVPDSVCHTAAGRLVLRKKAATVPPPIPIGLAVFPVTDFMALARAFTTGASLGVGSVAGCL